MLNVSGTGAAASPTDSAENARAAATHTQLSFEQILERLEGVVGELERGELPLEQALAAFERGVMLSRKGAAQLDDAERRIEVLLGDADSVALRPFDKELDNDE